MCTFVPLLAVKLEERPSSGLQLCCYRRMLAVRHSGSCWNGLLGETVDTASVATEEEVRMEVQRLAVGPTA